MSVGPSYGTSDRGVNHPSAGGESLGPIHLSIAGGRRPDLAVSRGSRDRRALVPLSLRLIPRQPRKTQLQEIVRLPDHQNSLRDFQWKEDRQHGRTEEVRVSPDILNARSARIGVDSNEELAVRVTQLSLQKPSVRTHTV